MWGFHDGMGWWMVFGSVWMLAFWAIVIWLVVWGLSRLTGDWRGSRTAEETPLEIARKRLARGEITPEEFQSLKETLQ